MIPNGILPACVRADTTTETSEDGLPSPLTPRTLHARYHDEPAYPWSKDAFLAHRKHWKKAGYSALLALRDRVREEATHTTSLEDIRRRIEASWAALKAEAAVATSEHAPDAEVALLAGRGDLDLPLAVSALHAVDTAEGAPFSALTEAFIHRLNTAQKWLPIRKTFDVRSSHSHLKTVVSEIIPANAGLHETFAAYEHTGVSSYAQHTTTRAVNLARTRLSCADGTVLFDGFRSGTLCPLLLADPTQRKEGALARMHHTLTALLLAHLEKMPEDLRAAALEGTHEVHVPATFLCLMSLMDQEREWSKEHAETIETYNRLSCEKDAPVFHITTRGVSYAVKARFDIAFFQFGARTDEYEHDGWALAEEANRKSMGVLKKHVDAFLRATESTNILHQTVAQLWESVVALWNTKVYQHVHEEPHALHTRLALLTHLSQGSFLFNCKSGKDRSGLMDAEIKHMAHRIAHSMAQARMGFEHTLPAPNTPLTQEEKAVFQEMCFRGGNWELQRYNNGASGFRVKRVAHPALVNNIGGSHAWTLLAGLTPYINQELVLPRGGD